MNQNTDILHEAKRLRLLAAALELQHFTSSAANVVPIPGGDQVIAIGTPAQLREVLPTTQVQPGIDLDLDKLEALALAYTYENGDHWYCLPQIADGITYEPAANFITGLSPATALALIARARVAQSVDAATICDGVAAKSKNSLFRSGAKICAGEIRAALAGDQADSEGGHHD